MWLITDQGFYSVVEHRDDPDLLLVRCRVKADLKRLRKNQLPGLQMFTDKYADYPYRAVVSRADWQKALVELAAGIDYDNFKNAVKAKQGAERAAVYMRVWSTLYSLTQRRRWWPTLRLTGPEPFVEPPDGDVIYDEYESLHRLTDEQWEAFEREGGRHG